MPSIINADTTSGVIITSDTSGEIALQANGVTKAKVTANGLQDANGNSIAGGMYRNRIINGDMRIDARNAGASVATTPIDGIYTLDRWQAVFGVASKFTVQQNAGSVTPPSGFNYYLGITSTSAYTSGSSDYLYMHQKIEGYNVGDLAWGTASAKTVTLSFLVRSSLTGTFGGALANVDNTRNYAFNYTISAANTWEQKTITITGDTSGTWNTTNGVGLRVLFNIGSGSSLLTTAGSWGSTWVSGGTGSTAITGTNGATWYVTGVQLEVGSGASDFEHLPYDVQLARCHRYFERKSYINGQTVAIASGEHATYGSGLFTYEYKRTNATLSSSAASTFALTTSSSFNRNCTAVSFYNKGTHSCMIEPVIAESEFGDGACRMVYGTGGSTYIDISAEL